VLLVVVGAGFLGRHLAAALGAQPGEAFLEQPSGPDFLAAARAALEYQVTGSFGITLLLIVLAGLVRRARLGTYFRFESGNLSWKGIVRYGAVVALISTAPANLLQAARETWALGEETWWWQFQRTVEWDWRFLVYTAVVGWLSVAVFEEIYSRGYTLTRLQEDLSAGGSIVLSASFLMLMHVQYYSLDVLNLGTLAVGMFHMSVWGYAVYRTGSLVPAVMGHAVVNLPLEPFSALALSGVGVVLALRFRRQVREHVVGFVAAFDGLGDLAWITASIAVFLTLMLTAMTSREAYHGWLVGLTLATALLSIPFRARRRAVPGPAPPSTS
jgi:membrane protease YdiL (CAAX protease family)